MCCWIRRSCWVLKRATSHFTTLIRWIRASMIYPRMTNIIIWTVEISINLCHGIILNIRCIRIDSMMNMIGRPSCEPSTKCTIWNRCSIRSTRKIRCWGLTRIDWGIKKWTSHDQDHHTNKERYLTAKNGNMVPCQKTWKLAGAVWTVTTFLSPRDTRSGEQKMPLSWERLKNDWGNRVRYKIRRG